MPRIAMLFATVLSFAFAYPVSALDAVLCVSMKGNGPPKFRAAKPPAPAACKKTEIQIGHFDGTTLQFTGINVQILSGSGATDGALNGKGNLIVGYNKSTRGQSRTGSNNLVVGDEHEYTSYGGLVAGRINTIAGPWASVSGGDGTTASGSQASICGGGDNVASGDVASVSGGVFNTANGLFSSISGGGHLTQPAATGWAAGSDTPGNAINGDFESP